MLGQDLTHPLYVGFCMRKNHNLNYDFPFTQGCASLRYKEKFGNPNSYNKDPVAVILEWLLIWGPGAAFPTRQGPLLGMFLE